LKEDIPAQEKLVRYQYVHQNVVMDYGLETKNAITETDQDVLNVKLILDTLAQEYKVQPQNVQLYVVMDLSKEQKFVIMEIKLDVIIAKSI
jgi:hypothetical protein